ncbi:MAG: GNAT family N-acetyltransferase [Pseudorhodobacter sp.]
MTIELIDRIVEIEAERLKLRRIRNSDSALIALYTGDARVAKTTSRIPHPLPPCATETFIAQAMKPDTDELVWVIDGSQSGLPEVLGVISLKTMDRGQSAIGYWIAPGFWNNGYASEALRAILKANPLGNRTIFAEVFQDNPGSARVLTNYGFDYLGDAESFCVSRNACVPTWTYIRNL